MPRCIPNLEAAVNYCRKNNIPFQFEWCSKSPHIKFYVASATKFVLIGTKNDNRDKVIKDIKRIQNG